MGLRTIRRDWLYNQLYLAFQTRMSIPTRIAMTSASTITVTMVDNPRIYHGIWHSNGSTFPQGMILTVNTAVFTIYIR